MAVFFKLDIDILYVQYEGISNMQIHFSPVQIGKSTTPLKLLLASDGFIDSVYTKHFINTAGIAQAIIFEVISMQVFKFRHLILCSLISHKFKSNIQFTKTLNIHNGNKKNHRLLLATEALLICQ